MDYWRECIEEGFSECGIQATEEQVKFMTDMVEGAHENYGMAFGHHCIPDPIKLENKELRKKLEREENSIVCGTCNGRGSVSGYMGGNKYYTSECHKCSGRGKIYR